ENADLRGTPADGPVADERLELLQRQDGCGLPAGADEREATLGGVHVVSAAVLRPAVHPGAGAPVWSSTLAVDPPEPGILAHPRQSDSGTAHPQRLAGRRKPWPPRNESGAETGFPEMNR